MFKSVRFAPAGPVRIVPGCEALVPIRVLARVDQNDRMLQRCRDRRVIGRDELIQNLDAGLERRRFASVNAVRQPDDDWHVLNNLIEVGTRF